MGEYKIKNGKPVKRTKAEQLEFERLKSEYYANVEKTNPKSKRMPKIEEPFIPITLRQAAKLKHESGKSDALTWIFLICLNESYRHHRHPFTIPTDTLAKDGFSRATQKRVIARLEKAGLISVERKHKKPPVIVVI